LQACVKEGLRMYPPVTGLLAKAVPPEGATIDGKFVKGGTQISWNSWGMQRDKDIYGVDPEIFRPERWLLRDSSEAEKRRVDRMTETVTLVFGYGRFGCLGRGVATMELNKGIIEVNISSQYLACAFANNHHRRSFVTIFNPSVSPNHLSSVV
jgi:cytochrome P450